MEKKSLTSSSCLSLSSLYRTRGSMFFLHKQVDVEGSCRSTDSSFRNGFGKVPFRSTRMLPSCQFYAHRTRRDDSEQWLVNRCHRTRETRKKSMRSSEARLSRSLSSTSFRNLLVRFQFTRSTLRLCSSTVLQSALNDPWNTGTRGGSA